MLVRRVLDSGPSTVAVPIKHYVGSARVNRIPMDLLIHRLVVSAFTAKETPGSTEIKSGSQSSVL